MIRCESELLSMRRRRKADAGSDHRAATGPVGDAKSTPVAAEERHIFFFCGADPSGHWDPSGSLFRLRCEMMCILRLHQISTVHSKTCTSICHIGLKTVMVLLFNLARRLDH